MAIGAFGRNRNAEGEPEAEREAAVRAERTEKGPAFHS